MAKSSAFASTFFCRDRSKRAIEISSFHKEATQARLCSELIRLQHVAGTSGGRCWIRRDLGNAEFGADSSAMQTQLKNVQQIQASDGAFAAILDAEGSVDSPGMLLLRSYGCLFLVLIGLVRNSLGGGPFRYSKISKLQEPRPAAHKICILSLSFGRLRGVWCFFTRRGVSPKALFGWSVQENAAWNKAKVHPSRQG